MKQQILSLIFIFSLKILVSQSCIDNNTIPFKADKDYLKIWNGSEYVPFFIKGVNLGVSLPGRQPGELEVTRAQYARWFKLIKDAGFNCIRLYTLHYPHFYEVLDSFNRANPQNPLLFFQGVWLDEEKENYNNDLFFLTATFQNEIEENVDCVHGNRTIPHRYGKAFGNYRTDVSKWLIGYIIGREVYPEEVLQTNINNSNIERKYSGKHFAIEDATPAEIWFVKQLDYLVAYEFKKYNTQRPVSQSSWPTLDPLHHPYEWNRLEDTASIGLNKMVLVNAPAGYFASYHAYPYYPDFMSEDPRYKTFSDEYGRNPYLGYLTNLKNYYTNYPLVIAEYGVPSSWGIAHYSYSGMNHGGFDELEQGNTNIRLLKNIEQSGCAGGIQFSFMDEWFKRTWICDPFDYLNDRRPLWHNITSAEQNYGIIGFKKQIEWNKIADFENGKIKSLLASSDYAFLNLKIILKKPLKHPDEMWIGIDTYSSDLGESILPNGYKINNRAEFALHISNSFAHLYVTEAYDLFGIWHKTSNEKQKYRSIKTDGAPWYMVRWKNNKNHEDVQYIGNMKTNPGIIPQSSRDAVRIYNDSILIRIPWSLINFVDPSSMKVFHDDRKTPDPEDTVSDGLAFSVFYENELHESPTRYVWPKWDFPTEIVEYQKQSYWVMKDRLTEFNTPAIATCDSYKIEKYDNSPLIINEKSGLLVNDFDLDGNNLQAIIFEEPKNGKVKLNKDGSFEYKMLTHSKTDTFSYMIFDGLSLSTPTKVYLSFENINEITENNLNKEEESLILFPNPVSEDLTIKSSIKIDSISIFDINGRLIYTIKISETLNVNIDVSNLTRGNYFAKIDTHNKSIVRVFTKE